MRLVVWNQQQPEMGYVTHYDFWYEIILFLHQVNRVTGSKLTLSDGPMALLAFHVDILSLRNADFVC